jgi:hypothetical protein
MSSQARTIGSDPRSLVRRVKRWSVSATVVGFAAFWGLTAAHPVGVTATHSQTSASPSTTVPVEAGSATRRTPTTSTSRRTASSGISNRAAGSAVLSSGSS